MDFHFENNTIKIIHQNKTFNLHPIWLRERRPGDIPVSTVPDKSIHFEQTKSVADMCKDALEHEV